MMKHAYISFKKQGIFKLFCFIGIVLFGLSVITKSASANSVVCGDLVTGNVNLTANLDCSFISADFGPMLVVEGPARLNLNGFKVIGNGSDSCIELTGSKAKVRNGTVTQCGDGVVIAGTGRHKVFRIKSIYNEKTGFKVRGNSNGNRLTWNEAIGNAGSNFLIETESCGNHLMKNKAEDSVKDRGYYVRGSNNRLYKNKADGNYDDALRIRNGTKNIAKYNIFSDTESGEGVEIDSEYNVVRKNIIKQNNRGIRIRKNDNVVKENIILNSGLEGIRVESSDNRLSGNFIKHNGFVADQETGIFRDGIKLETGAMSNRLTRNLLFSNSGNGINVDKGATGNKIDHNMAIGNGVDDSYYDALEGNPDCEANTWCANYFGTIDPGGCIGSEKCWFGRDYRPWHDLKD
jgi:parallel beta-helix repeat protein